MHAPPAKERPRSRRAKLLLAAAALLVAIPLAVVVFVLTFDWNRARPWLNDKVSQAIERPFAIRGDLSVTWEVPARRMHPQARRFRDYIPWPYLVANDVRVGNPATLPQREMASVEQFSFSLNPLALPGRRIHIPLLRFRAPEVALERLADGRNNWTFPRKEKKSDWKLDLERVAFSDGVLHVRDALRKVDVTANLESLARDERYGVGWKLKGRYNGTPVSGSGKAGAVLSLQHQDTPYPIKASLDMNLVSLDAEGTLTKPAQLAAIDMQMKASGASMARLYGITGVVFPETPPFSTEGHLMGRLGGGESRWTYDKFKGKVGASDIGGKIEYRTGKPRGLLTANVRSRRLDFADLGPLIGADSNAKKKLRGAEAVQPAGKVLPVERFKTERWSSVDADVRFSAGHIIREKQLPITELSTHLVLKNSVITLDPLKFTMAGGHLTSHIRLDGRGPAGKDAIKATADLSARHLKLNQLFPAIEQMKASIGEVNGDAKLSAKGDSVATMLAGSNGEVKAMITQGTISKLLLEQMGLNIGNIVLTKLFGDKPVRINCLASDLGVTDGVASTRVFVADTEEAIVNVTGKVNLATEQLDLTLKPETKELRLLSLRAPIYVRGTFDKPDVDVDKKVLALKAGGAALLGSVAAPLAALVPLVNAGPGEDSPCGQLLARVRAKPQAPPPGKRR